MIFAQTDRLILRALEQSELPRLVELIGAWDVARWLAVVPFPYRIKDAEEFYDDIAPKYAGEAPEFFAIAPKSDNLLIGGIALHTPRLPEPVEGEVEIGYWLGKPFWGQGLMSEAVRAVIDIGFARDATQAIGATTAPGNQASQNILRKAGLRDLGILPRAYKTLRGSDEVVRWLITREEWEEISLAPVRGRGRSNLGLPLGKS